MGTKIIDGVKIQKDSKQPKGYVLHIPRMTGSKLEKWRKENKEAIQSFVDGETRKYSIDCEYYTRSFDTFQELISDVMASGMDPAYEITENGIPIGEDVIDHIVE